MNLFYCVLAMVLIGPSNLKKKVKRRERRENQLLILTFRSLELVSMHSFKHVSRKSTWFCINSSTVVTFSLRCCRSFQFGSRTSLVEKYNSCCTKTSIRALRVNARRFQNCTCGYLLLYLQDGTLQ